MSVEPGTTMREWNKLHGTNAAPDSVPVAEPDPMLAVLERIAAALEKIAERRT